MLAECDGPRLRSRWRGVSARRLGFALLSLCGGLLVLSLLGFGVLALRLAHGPIGLDSLTPRIAKSLEEKFGHRYSFALGPTALERGENGVTIGFQGVAIKDRAGRTLLAAPKGDISLDLPALATLDVKAKRLELVGLDLRLTVQPDGSLSVEGAKEPDAISIDLPAPKPLKGAAAEDPNKTAAPAFAAQLGPLVWNLIEAVTSQDQALDRLGVAHGRLEVEDGATHQKVVFEDLNLAFDKSAAVAGLTMSALGPAGRWSIAVKAQGVGLHALSVEVHDINLADLLLATGRKVPFEATMPVSAKLDLELAADKSLAAMRGRFGLGAGYFKLDDPDHEPFLVDEVTGGWSWDASSQRFLIDNVQLFADETHVFFDGSVSPPSADNPAWAADLSSSDTVLAGERPGEQAVHLDKAVFQARYLVNEKRFTVDNFAISGLGANGTLKSEAVITPAGPTLKLKLDMANTSAVNIARLWPSFIAADVRNWCIQNLRGGELVAASLSLDWDAPTFALALKKQPVPADSVHGEFSARDISAQLLPGVPIVSGLEGGGVLTGHDFTMTGKRGFMDVSPGRRIVASDIAFAVPDTSPKPLNPARASAHLQGSADALADLISRDALKPFVGLPIDPGSVKGQFDGDLVLDLKLGKTARPEDAVVHANATLSNFQVDKFLGNEHFEQGALNVTEDAGVLKIVGDGKLFGVAANVEIDKGPTDDGAVQLSFTFDDAARAKRGFNLGPTLTGPMAFRVKAPLSQKGAADVEVDLSRMNIDNPAPGIVKLAGKPGKATFSVKSDPDGTTVSNLVIDMGATSIKGGVQLSGDGAFTSAKLSQLRISSGDELKADVSSADGVLKIAVRGSVVDSRPIVKAMLEQGPSEAAAKDFDVDLKVNSATGANKVSLNQLEIGLSRRGGELSQARVDARLGSAGLTLRRDESGVLRLETADAGSLVRFFNLYSHLEGGALDLVMRNVGGRQEGEAVVKDFVLRNEPALRQLVAAGQQPAPGANGVISSGPTANGATRIDAEAVPFQKMTAKFARSSGRIDLREAVIYDIQMGLTTEGYIDYARDHIDLNGTFVPAYQVNNLVTHIPFVGLLLGGGTNEGLFGVNYRLAGPGNAPVLTINPFSAMTPGFLRKVFGAIDGTTPPLPQGDIPQGQSPAGIR
ncbi:DUF3971 domain-containing protein [Methylocapsa sp. S129]|uniref:YhdP family protein n=1 Tax=Methylocapsa sp. S129 TaxID=1641869 RepID=UPI00131A8346|nr:DUF3971 domain-containing protein [Methylocapsa sp. S129]